MGVTYEWHFDLEIPQKPLDDFRALQEALGIEIRNGGSWDLVAAEWGFLNAVTSAVGRSVDEYFLDALNPLQSPTTQWGTSNFFFEFGFFADPRGRRAVLQIEDSIWMNMAVEMTEPTYVVPGYNPVKYICDLYRALGARRMIGGIEIPEVDVARALYTSVPVSAECNPHVTIGIPREQLPKGFLKRERLVEWNGVTAFSSGSLEDADC